MAWCQIDLCTVEFAVQKCGDEIKRVVHHSNTTVPSELIHVLGHLSQERSNHPSQSLVASNTSSRHLADDIAQVLAG